MSKTYTLDWGGKALTVELGKLAHQASGSALVRYGDTVVLATVSGSGAVGAFTERVRCTRSWRLAEGHEEWQAIATHVTAVRDDSRRD